jgi:serine phosphatase RsbU (regulator of sigma subunit)
MHSTAPIDSDEIDPALQTWRVKALHVILVVVALAGLPAWGAPILNGVRQGQFTVLLWIYGAVYLSMVALAALPRVDFRFRAWAFVMLGYTNAVVSFARLGLMGSGRLYLLVIPIFATVLIGSWAGVLTTGFSLAVYGLFLTFVYLGWPTLLRPTEVPSLALDYWIEAGIALVVFLACAVILLRRFYALQRCTLQSERQARAELELLNARLEDYSHTLEERVAQRTADLARANARFVQELALAARIQTSFLPQKLPHVSGWRFAATLIPAAEMSGDFYDVYPLPDGRLALLIADVVDKGVGAALCMVLTWALLRTYAAEHPERPSLVLDAVNRRLLTDTQGNQFVTVFYGILEPASGRLVYSNAGHHPPVLFKSSAADDVVKLARTGMPLGISEEAVWESEEVCLGLDNVLVLYTDGVTDALSDSEAPFGFGRLIESVRASLDLTVEEIQDALLRDVQAFGGDAPQMDDIALLILARVLSPGEPAKRRPDVSLALRGDSVQECFLTADGRDDVYLVDVIPDDNLWLYWQGDAK